MTAEDAIHELGNHIGIELKLDENRCCGLVFDSKVHIDFEAPEELPRTLVMSAAVAAEIPPDERGEAHRLALEANFFGRGTGGAVLAIDEDRNELVLQRLLPLEHSDFEDLSEAIELLVQHAEAWTERLQGTRPAAVDTASPEDTDSEQAWSPGNLV